MQAMQVERRQSTPVLEDDPLSTARGCVLAFGIAVVIWAITLVWLWWVMEQLLGILGG